MRLWGWGVAVCLIPWGEVYYESVWKMRNAKDEACVNGLQMDRISPEGVHSENCFYAWVVSEAEILQG